MKRVLIPARLDAVLAVVAIHRRRIEESLTALGDRWPRSGAAVTSMAHADFADVEVVLSRFAKMQDLMGAKVFRMVLELVAEIVPVNASHLDVVHRLEGIGALPSSDRWLRLREIRNVLAHDYPDDADTVAANIGEVMAAIPDLFAVDDAIRAYVALHRPAT